MLDLDLGSAKLSNLLSKCRIVKVSSVVQKSEYWQFLVVWWLILVLELFVVGWFSCTCLVR